MSVYLTKIQAEVFDQLIPIFPNLERDVITDSLKHLSNNPPGVTQGQLLQLCIDDLLELRTFSAKKAEEDQLKLDIESDWAFNDDLDLSTFLPEDITNDQTPAKVALKVEPSVLKVKPSGQAAVSSVLTAEPSVLKDKPSGQACVSSVLKDKPSGQAAASSVLKDKPSWLAAASSLATAEPSVLKDKPSGLAAASSVLTAEHSVLKSKPTGFAANTSVLTAQPSGLTPRKVRDLYDTSFSDSDSSSENPDLPDVDDHDDDLDLPKLFSSDSELDTPKSGYTKTEWKISSKAPILTPSKLQGAGSSTSPRVVLKKSAFPQFPASSTKDSFSKFRESCDIAENILEDDKEVSKRDTCTVVNSVSNKSYLSPAKLNVNHVQSVATENKNVSNSVTNKNEINILDRKEEEGLVNADTVTGVDGTKTSKAPTTTCTYGISEYFRKHRSSQMYKTFVASNWKRLLQTHTSEEEAKQKLKTIVEEYRRKVYKQFMKKKLSEYHDISNPGNATLTSGVNTSLSHTPSAPSLSANPQQPSLGYVHNGCKTPYDPHPSTSSRNLQHGNATLSKSNSAPSSLHGDANNQKNLLGSFSLLKPGYSPTLIPRTSTTTATSISPVSAPNIQPNAALGFIPNTIPRTPTSTATKISPGSAPNIQPNVTLGFIPNTIPRTSTTTATKISPVSAPNIQPNATLGFIPNTYPRTSTTTATKISPGSAPNIQPNATLGFIPNTYPRTSTTTATKISPGSAPNIQPNATLGFIPKTIPKTSTTTATSISPGSAPNIQPNAALGFIPNTIPRTSTTMATKISPGSAPNIQPNLTVGISPTSFPGISPFPAIRFSPPPIPTNVIAKNVLNSAPGNALGTNAGYSPISPASGNVLRANAGSSTSTASANPVVRMPQEPRFSLNRTLSDLNNAPLGRPEIPIGNAQAAPQNRIDKDEKTIKHQRQPLQDKNNKQPKRDGSQSDCEITHTSMMPSSHIQQGPGNPTNPASPPILIPDEAPPDVNLLTSTVLSMFPDAIQGYIRELVVDKMKLRLTNDVIINEICNYLMDHDDYPRSYRTTITTDKQVALEDTTDYYAQSVYSKEVTDPRCRMQTEQVLQHYFSWISVKDIRTVMKLYGGHFAPCYKVFTKVMRQKAQDVKHPSLSGSTITVTVSVGSEEKKIKVHFLKCRRNTREARPLRPDLKKEVDFVKRQMVKESEEADHQMALKLNEDEYEETGQLIECGCCYTEVPFESMVQCYEGHLFCLECLQRYAKEAVYGSGKADLMCMTDGCDATYPQTQLNKALPSNILSKYEDRVQEENINLADLTDLVRCPHCDFAALLDQKYPAFECMNQSCLKKTCRHCKENWSEHIGKTCDQVEKKDEVKLRLQFEEKMSEAKIRTCHRCKTKFTKNEGCNKMTCRCGATMCYICREKNIHYNHFCQHVRDPGKDCSKCKACFLWSTGEEDDKRAINEIKNQAEAARKAQGFQEIKLIGAPDEEPKPKKLKTQHGGLVQV